MSKSYEELEEDIGQLQELVKFRRTVVSQKMLEAQQVDADITEAWRLLDEAEAQLDTAIKDLKHELHKA